MQTKGEISLLLLNIDFDILGFVFFNTFLKIKFIFFHPILNLNYLAI